MNSRWNEARGLFLVYNVSTIALVLTMSIYSSYLTWWWQNVEPTPYLNYNEWKSYYFGFLIMTILGIILFVWSILVLIGYLMNGGLFSEGFDTYVNFSVIVHAVFLLIPLLTMWISKVIDSLFIIWMIWVVINIIMGLVLSGYFGRRVDTNVGLIDVRA